LKALLDRCRSSNIKINKEKIKLRQTELRYIGHVISKEGIKPDPEKIAAIADLPTPTDVTGLKRFLGMVGYLQKFIPNLSKETEPLRILERKETAWHWGCHQEKAF